MRLCPLFLIIGLYTSGQTEGQNYLVNPKARQLKDSAARIAMDSENYTKAIALLNEAIKLDSNYYPAYTNKLSFQLALKQYSDALPTAKKINMLRPDDPVPYVSIGLLCEVLHDTISSQKYFAAADSHFNNILDTMDRTNIDYEQIMMNKGINLILLGQQQNGNELLRQLYEKSTVAL
jgi:tetratricopeptide (TPR) repeat protein